MNRGVPIWLSKNWSRVRCLPWEEPGEAWAYRDVEVSWSTFLAMSDRGIIEQNTTAEPVARRTTMWELSQDVRDYVTKEHPERFDLAEE